MHQPGLISPGFGSLEHQTEPIKRLSSKSVPVSISLGFTLGSVALCDRAVDDIVGHIHVRDLNLSLSAQYDFHGHRSPAFSYQFAPLGWRVPRNTGAQRPPPPPDVEWSNAITFGGSAGPSLSFIYEPGEALEPTVDLISVPIGQGSETLIEQGRSTLQAALGPQLSFGLTFNRKELAKEANDVEEGKSPEMRPNRSPSRSERTSAVRWRSRAPRWRRTQRREPRRWSGMRAR